MIRIVVGIYILSVTIPGRFERLDSLRPITTTVIDHVGEWLSITRHGERSDSLILTAGLRRYMTRVVAVRHGETDWNRQRRMQGWAPVPLNETGREQARATGAWLSETYDFDRVLSSDLLRSEQTTELLIEARDDVPVSFESALRERHLGVYQGLSYADVEDRYPTFGLDETAYRATDAVPEGGESFREVENRVTQRFDDLTTTDAETVLLVTHGGPLCILLGHAKGFELTESLSAHRPDNCSATEFLVDDEVSILRENVTEWDRA